MPIPTEPIGSIPRPPRLIQAAEDSCVPRYARSHAVHQHPEQPRLEGGAAFEAVQAPE
jgi:hypothetical protein